MMERNEMVYRGYLCKSRWIAMETQVALGLSGLFVIQRKVKNLRNNRWDENDQRSMGKGKGERGKSTEEKKKEWRFI